MLICCSILYLLFQRHIKEEPKPKRQGNWNFEDL